jgi:hypothetical protein
VLPSVDFSQFVSQKKCQVELKKLEKKQKQLIS